MNMSAIRIYYHNAFKCEAVSISPGQFYVTDQDILIGTTLGSCVAACIRDRLSGIGGMNHFLLPYYGNDPGNADFESARYGAYAMDMLIKEVINLGAVKKNLEAKVFGGGNVSGYYSTLDIGKNNAKFVRQYLNEKSINITAEDLADFQGRTIYFSPRSGKVWVRKLAVVTPTILDMEKEYPNTIESDLLSGEMDMF